MGWLLETEAWMGRGRREPYPPRCQLWGLRDEYVKHRAIASLSAQAACV